MTRVWLGSDYCQQRVSKLFFCFLRFSFLSLFLCLLSAVAVAQDSSANAPQNEQGTPDQQSSPSDLAAAAKLAKEQRAQQSARKTERSQAVDEMAQELSLSQEEPIAGAPTGYRYYYFQPGDYAILVPADAKPNSRDDYGLHLRSSETFSSRVDVILGDSIPGAGSRPEEILHNANDIFFGACSVSIIGVGPPVNGHPAHDMAYQNCGLPEGLIGRGELVVGDGYVVPVICGYPKDGTETNPNRSPKDMLRAVDIQRQAYQVCGTILASLKFHPYGNRWTEKKLPPVASKPAPTPLASTETTTTGEQTSLGAFARAQRKSPQKAELTDLKGSAAGIQPYSFRYFCTKERGLCFSANLQIPENAKPNQQFPTSGKGLFQFEVPVGKTTVFIQGNTGVSTDSGILTREQMINGKMAWFLGYVPVEHYSGVKHATILNESLTDIGGFPARTATFKNETSSETVLTYMAVYMFPGAFVHIRCTVAEKFSGDTQSLCERVTQSLEFPKQLGEELQVVDDSPKDDPPKDDEQ
jgi:hypothetical protein